MNCLPVLRVAAHERRTAGFELLGRLICQLPGGGDELWPAVDEERLARQVAVRLVERAGGQGPLVMLDDLQWADGAPHCPDTVAERCTCRWPG